MRLEVEMDAWSDGQIESKLWLCRELEKLNLGSSVVWILGAWYGLTGFLLLSRERWPIKSIRSFDIDAMATQTADLVNKNWEIKNWLYKAFTIDCNELDYESTQFGDLPDVIINTACEHFNDLSWWQKIPSGKIVALQSTDQNHDNDESTLNIYSVEEMKATYKNYSRVLYEGKLEFNYPDRSFVRYMLIVEK